MDLREYKTFITHYRGKHREAALKGLHSAAMRAVQIIQTEIIPSRVPQPVDRGLFRAGWRWKPESTGALIYNVEPHAAFVEFGVRAGNVKIGKKMILALAEWAVRKKLAEPGKKAIAAAWAIAKTMQRRGIFKGDGLRILEELVDVYLPDLVQEEIAAEIEFELTVQNAVKKNMRKKRK